MFPTVTAKQMLALDEYMMNDVGVSLPVMMEHTGSNLAVLVADSAKRKKRVTVLVGKGHNGGGGLVAARILQNIGFDVTAILTEKRSKLKPATKKQVLSAEACDVDIVETSWLTDEGITDYIHTQVVVDAMLGYNAKGALYGEVARVTELMQSVKPYLVVALDIPTGVHPNTGSCQEPHVMADITMTIAAPKKGLLELEAAHAVGHLFVSDISVPYAWYRRRGMKKPPFKKSSIIHVRQ